MISIPELRTLQAKVLCLGTYPDIIQSMLDYDYLCGHKTSSIVAIISQGRKQERYFWGDNEIEIPVLPGLGVLSDQQKSAINCVLDLQSGRRVLTGMHDAMQALPGLRVSAIFAEQVPEAHALEIAKIAHQQGVLVVGPASVGLLVPGALKLGAIGGTTHQQIMNANIASGGDTAVISTSGGMVNELIHMVTESGLRISFAMALGGDRVPVISPAEAFLLAETDVRTKQIVYFGELGGNDEYEIARLVHEQKSTKKVVAYIAGTVAELFEAPPQFGHAKAMAHTLSETASAKKEALKAAGVTVVDTLAGFAPILIAHATQQKPLPNDDRIRTIGVRHKHLLASHLSGEKQHEVQLLGEDLLRVVEANSLASLILSMLLGSQVSSVKLTEFLDYVLRLLSDHGPYAAGALNTIVAARAGKDLVSSLAAGLLTIGPRFGGAINESASHWLRGVHSGLSPKEFVDTFRANGGIIPGIGHRKYRIDLPDPRITTLRRFAVRGSDTYLDFALGVQAVTTSKKGNLILNVDGAIAAILLDLLATELNYDETKLRELVDIEFFNTLFVLSRSIGLSAHYLDQRRHDEGLLRLTDQDVSYFPLG
jgi:ATP citrate (pro-S)-lyase